MRNHLSPNGFKGVRTFGQQMTHVASVMYSISGTVLGEKPPAEVGTGENGPDSLKGTTLPRLAELGHLLRWAISCATCRIGDANNVDVRGHNAAVVGIATNVTTHGFT
jgi:hypothetical protein